MRKIWCIGTQFGILITLLVLLRPGRIQNVRTQRTEDAHLALNSTVFRHSRTGGMDFRRPWQPGTFRCPACLHRLVCVPVGFTVRIERSIPGAPGSPGGPPPGTPDSPATIPSGGPGSPRDPVLRSVSPEPAEGAARDEAVPSQCSDATVVLLPAGGATVVPEATASASRRSSGGMGSPSCTSEPPARRPRFN